MPLYRMEVRVNRVWHMLAALTRETPQDAIRDIRQTLPRRCEGNLVRAIEIRARPPRASDPHHRIVA